MKFFSYLMIFFLVLSVAAFFFIKRPDGQPWLKVQGFMPNTQTMVTNAQSFTNNAINKVVIKVERVIATNDEVKTKIYKWQDSKGIWHFSDKQASSVKSEEVWFDSADITVMPAIKDVSVPAAVSNKKQAMIDDVPMPMTISPSKVTKLIEDAKQVQQILDNRHAAYLKDL